MTEKDIAYQSCLQELRDACLKLDLQKIYGTCQSLKNLMTNTPASESGVKRLASIQQGLDKLNSITSVVEELKSFADKIIEYRTEFEAYMEEDTRRGARLEEEVNAIRSILGETQIAESIKESSIRYESFRIEAAGRLREAVRNDAPAFKHISGSNPVVIQALAMNIVSKISASNPPSRKGTRGGQHSPMDSYVLNPNYHPLNSIILSTTGAGSVSDQSTDTAIFEAYGHELLYFMTPASQYREIYTAWWNKIPNAKKILIAATNHVSK